MTIYRYIHSVHKKPFKMNKVRKIMDFRKITRCGKTYDKK